MSVYVLWSTDGNITIFGIYATQDQAQKVRETLPADKGYTIQSWPVEGFTYE